jgi:hypothetical protein
VKLVDPCEIVWVFDYTVKVGTKIVFEIVMLYIGLKKIIIVRKVHAPILYLRALEIHSI